MTSSTKGNARQNDGLRFGELAIDYSELPEPSQYTARDDTVLPVRHYPLDTLKTLEPPASTDRVLVLIHGSGYHSRYLMPLAKRIAASGAAQVYTPDLRGHGTSPARRGDIDYADQLEDDLVDLITHIQEANPGARVFVGGHSSGGGLALRFAGSGHGSESAGFVLLAPFLRHDAPTTRSNAGGWAKTKILRIIALAILNAMGVSRFDDSVVIEFSMPEEVRDGTETLAYTHRLNTGLAPRHYESDLEAIETPLLVLVGDDDEAFIAEKFPETVSHHAPGAVVEIVADASHMGIVVGEASADIIIRWLETR